MKKMLCLLLFFSFGIVCFAQDVEKLPEIPWKEIVEMKQSDLRRGLRTWNGDVKVALDGDYTNKDSIEVSKILKRLDSVTETISIGFSDYKTSNVQIKFSGIRRQTNVKFDYKYDADYEISEVLRYIGEAYVVLQRSTKEDEVAYNFLEISLAKLLFTGFFITQHEDSGYNLFRTHERFDDINEYYLTDNDLKILEEIYKKEFEENLIIAEKQYKEEVLGEIESYKVLNRDRNLWWVKNPISVMLLPVLVLFLLFLWIIKKIKLIIDLRKNDEFTRFLFLSFIALIFVDVIVVFCVSFYDYLTIPITSGFTMVRLDTLISTLVFSLIVFPFLFLFRFIELKIKNTAKSIITKSGLIFLSTGFLPFTVVSVFRIIIILSKEEHDYGKAYLNLSYVFLCLMCIALMRALISYFIFKERSLIVENETELANLRALNAKAELKSLQAQINPHFLYNSLNSIASLALVDAHKTQKMAHSLSDLFKYSINRKGEKMSTVLEEVQIVETYLEIEKIRFGDRLEFLIDVEEEVKTEKIPLFLIQPLVENAFKHGVSQNEGKGEIALKIAKEKIGLVITVCDNGPDFPEGLVSGHGLQTVYDLLRLSYGDNASLNWTNTPKKMIKITLPQTR